MTVTANVDAKSDDYEIVSQVIEKISKHYREQPSLEELAEGTGMTPAGLQRTFKHWAGLSPKGFLQAVTLDHAKHLLDHEQMPILEASMELGLSGPSRLHDLFVTHLAMPPGIYKNRGAGLEIRYGFHPSPFGTALVMMSEYGLCGLAFCDSGDEAAMFKDMTGRWPNADYVEDQDATAPLASRIFERDTWKAEEPLRIVMIGSDFQLRVWEALLDVPAGQATTYSDIAKAIGNPRASRAVGAAVGRNPISFVVPCHRALGKSGSLTGYHWGLTRKRAILGWESGAAINA